MKKLQIFFLAACLVFTIGHPSVVHALAAIHDTFDGTIVYRSAYRVMGWDFNHWHYFGKGITRDEHVSYWVKIEVTSEKRRFNDTAELRVDDQYFILKHVQPSDKLSILGTSQNDLRRPIFDVGTYIVPEEAVVAIANCKNNIAIRYTFQNPDAKPLTYQTKETIRQEWIQIVKLTRNDLATVRANN